MAALHPEDDVPPQERRSGLGAGSRSDPTTAEHAVMELDRFRVELDAWLDEHTEDLAPDHPGLHTMDQQMAHLSMVKRMAFDAGWMRWGWPERVGGLGGTTLLRAYLGEALTSR